MSDIYQYPKYFAKIAATSKVILTKPAGLISAIPAVSAAMSTPQKALILLGVLFVLDFGTGIAASSVEFKKSLPVLPASGKRYVLQSSKLRLSAVKFVTYGMVVIVAYGLEWVFVMQEFEPSSKLQKLSLTTISIAFCCAIEFYSIFFENIKRMGFDVIQKVKNISKSGWDLYKTVKNDKTEDND